jgi:hypothetical protein
MAEASNFDKLFRKLIRRFREDFPTLYPVRVRRCEIEEEGSYGETELIYGKHGPYIVVRIEKREAESTQFLALIHELGHALDWGTPEQEAAKDELYQRGHGPSYGIAYAALFERLVGSV